LLGDGEFYVTFSVPPEVLKTWMRSDAPWVEKTWLRGPIPVEAGCYCGFGYQSPRGWQTTDGGSKEYRGGDPEILAVLMSRDVWYAGRDRGPEGNPWHNGDLLILDPKTGVIRYCSWDM
jgi:hypothetical protein